MERTKFLTTNKIFVEKGLVQKIKRMMDAQNESFREIKNNDHFKKKL